MLCLEPGRLPRWDGWIPLCHPQVHVQNAQGLCKDPEEGLGCRLPTRRKKGVIISKSLSERRAKEGLTVKDSDNGGGGVSASPLAYSSQYPNIFRLPVAGGISLC